jgi:type 1 glutamine amidotransferase
MHLLGIIKVSGGVRDATGGESESFRFAGTVAIQSEKLAGLRTDGDFPIVWATKYGMGRVWYSTSGHLEATLDDMHIQQMVQQKRRSQSSHEHARV